MLLLLLLLLLGSQGCCWWHHQYSRIKPLLSTILLLMMMLAGRLACYICVTLCCVVSWTRLHQVLTLDMRRLRRQVGCSCRSRCCCCGVKQLLLSAARAAVLLLLQQCGVWMHIAGPRLHSMWGHRV